VAEDYYGREYRGFLLLPRQPVEQQLGQALARFEGICRRKPVVAVCGPGLAGQLRRLGLKVIERQHMRNDFYLG
jgi:hypothetical protein